MNGLAKNVYTWARGLWTGIYRRGAAAMKSAGFQKGHGDGTSHHFAKFRSGANSGALNPTRLSEGGDHAGVFWGKIGRMDLLHKRSCRAIGFPGARTNWGDSAEGHGPPRRRAGMECRFWPDRHEGILRGGNGSAHMRPNLYEGQIVEDREGRESWAASWKLISGLNWAGVARTRPIGRIIAPGPPADPAPPARPRNSSDPAVATPIGSRSHGTGKKAGSVCGIAEIFCGFRRAGRAHRHRKGKGGLKGERNEPSLHVGTGTDLLEGRATPIHYATGTLPRKNLGPRPRGPIVPCWIAARAFRRARLRRYDWKHANALNAARFADVRARLRASASATEGNLSFPAQATSKQGGQQTAGTPPGIR